MNLVENFRIFCESVNKKQDFYIHSTGLSYLQGFY